MGHELTNPVLKGIFRNQVLISASLSAVASGIYYWYNKNGVEATREDFKMKYAKWEASVNARTRGEKEN